MHKTKLIKFTIVKSIFDNEIKPTSCHEMTWGKFCKIMSTHAILDGKHDAQLISPIDYYTLDNAVDTTDTGFVRRCADNINLWYMLGIDVDGQMDIDTAKEQFKDYEYVLYTTHSHRTVTKNFDCFRIFMLLSEPIANSDFKIRKESIQQFIGDSDLTTLSGSRAFYIPSCPKNATTPIFFHNQGVSLDVMSLEPTIEEIYVPDDDYKEPSPEFKARVLEILSNFSNLDYEIWWKIASAMYNGGYTESEFLAFTNQVRGHRTKSDKPAAQWKLSKRKGIPFGFLINLCKEHFPHMSLSTSTVVKDKALRTYNENLILGHKTKLQAPLDIPPEA